MGSTLPFLLLLLQTVVVHVSADQIPVIKYVQCANSTISNHPVVMKGKRFYDSQTDQYFPVKGIAYYPRPNEGTLSTGSNSVDFFTEGFRHLWEPDIAQLQQLGVNTIRIYAVDPSQNHDAFMCALQSVGIHVIVGLLADCDGCAIGPNEAPSCYPASLKARGQWIINEFSKYANTLAFSAGNEVTLYARDRQIQLNAPCQKKFLRDMRAYVSTCSEVLNSILPRKVPIGLVNWDHERQLQATYFGCQNDPNDPLEPVEWYGLNAYQHCNPNIPLVGWEQMRQDFEAINLPGPMIVAEYGCRESSFPTVGEFQAQRTWEQVDALYSETYSNVFAGGVVFEYSAEKLVADTSPQGNPWPYNGFMKLQYGVGYYTPLECDHLTTHCQYIPYPEYESLRTKLAAVDVSYVPNMSQQDNSNVGQIPQCPQGIPSILDFEWLTDMEPDLPCYVVATRPPTFAPSESPSMVPSATPSLRPTVSPTNFTESMDDDDNEELSSNDTDSDEENSTNPDDEDEGPLWYSSSTRSGFWLTFIAALWMSIPC
ncbi:3-beta-glucanosyltransferase [Seminavis robusta]|uniref:3-beta-glucanosyltransferase n=1 Tax=Seminavis robusta TaxID=568900 RepID=A0A9N8E7S7_9STRA|nr:3-beta-glucanosyltransferase [Seminavis robusta]|eukprot:Sro774_g200690.1 3-beta-glucanosyltransferase (540) ;mRNA; r:32318-33937